MKPTTRSGLKNSTKLKLENVIRRLIREEIPTSLRTDIGIEKNRRKSTERQFYIRNPGSNSLPSIKKILLQNGITDIHFAKKYTNDPKMIFFKTDDINSIKDILWNQAKIRPDAISEV